MRGEFIGVNGERMYMAAHFDRRGRPFRDLRISVTDRCNMRCDYCMPADVFDANHDFLPRSDLLTFEEIDEVVNSLISHGLKKVRITGGEPLLRRDLDVLIRMLSKHPLDLALTTNGLLFSKCATDLADAGLSRVTFSLDSLDPVTFERITGKPGNSIHRIIEGIEMAVTLGLSPVRINSVIRRGVNEADIERLIERFRHLPVALRFIEFMDVGNHNRWDLASVVPSEEIRQLVQERWNLHQMSPLHTGQVAQHWSLDSDTGFEVGFISSVTEPFCGDCNRARLSADGHIYTCLFATSGHDLRPVLRNPEGLETVAERFHKIWSEREDRYSELRAQPRSSTAIYLPRVEMSYIGG